MFETLTERLSKTIKDLTGRGRLTEDNIKDSLREVRLALLEADVALPVVKSFIDDIKEQALGQEVMQSLSPGQALIKIVHEKLIAMMGESVTDINFNAQPPVVILMAGLQGSGKTTTVGKLAKTLKEKRQKKVLVTSCDIYRPAAIKQLETLAHTLQVDFFPSLTTDNPLQIAKNAIEQAKKSFADVVIIDTAGRLHIDNEMMDEIKNIHNAIQPTETLFVVDSMTGQDAANTAKAFNDALPLTGVVLTKIDGDARGGAALSIRYLTGKPIKFLGVGEKLDALEPFHPERIASRILGMGDVLSLIEQVEEKIDKQQADKLAKKLKKGKKFDLEDFREQLKQMNKLGGVASLMDKLPGNMGEMAKKIKQQDPNKMVKRMEAIINSMTVQERRFPQIIKGSRKRRIAEGSGTDIPDVNKLLKQFAQMQKMLQKFSKGGMKNMMRSMQGMMSQQGGGGFPPFG
ncbi:MAG: signal recognition particle protein [Legionellales bacterium]|nr:signal recognition particle protein [Legionellales bacterium]